MSDFPETKNMEEEDTGDNLSTKDTKCESSSTDSKADSDNSNEEQTGSKTESDGNVSPSSGGDGNEPQIAATGSQVSGDGNLQDGSQVSGDGNLQDGSQVASDGNLQDLENVPAEELEEKFKKANEIVSKMVANLNESEMVRKWINSADADGTPFPLKERAIALRGATSWLSLIQNFGYLRVLPSELKKSTSVEGEVVPTESGDGTVQCSSSTLKLLDILCNLEAIIPIFEEMGKETNKNISKGSTMDENADFPPMDLNLPQSKKLEGVIKKLESIEPVEVSEDESASDSQAIAPEHEHFMAEVSKNLREVLMELEVHVDLALKK